MAIRQGRVRAWKDRIVAEKPSDCNRPTPRPPQAHRAPSGKGWAGSISPLWEIMNWGKPPNRQSAGETGQVDHEEHEERFQRAPKLTQDCELQRQVKPTFSTMHVLSDDFLACSVLSGLRSLFVLFVSFVVIHALVAPSAVASAGRQYWPVLSLPQ